MTTARRKRLSAAQTYADLASWKQGIVHMHEAQHASDELSCGFKRATE